jgi:hypothetical protein
VLIVKLITSACKNYVIITLSKLSHHKDMTTEELTTEVQKKKLDPFEFGRWRY